MLYSATQNNGQIIKQLGGPAGETVDYQYDVLNRLTSAVAEDSTWGQSYVYDGFGNLTQQNVTAGSAPSMSLTVNPANNRVSSALYDANGNQLYMPVGGSPVYDVENRIVADNNSRYFYNGSNQRVWKITGATEEFAFYGLQGERLASFNPNITTDSQGPHMSLTQAEMDGYFGSKLVYRQLASGAQGTVLQDRLGSARVDGSVSPQWTAYYPYGQERGSGTPNDRMKFGTYRRDADTDLDYAMNRYYLSNWGRFVSADPYQSSAVLDSPQSWNHYAYASNDPINRFDPVGLCDQDPNYSVTVCGGEVSLIPGSFIFNELYLAYFNGASNFMQGHGGGGGGGSVRQPKVTSTSGAAAALTYELQHLTPHCKTVLPSLSALTSDAKRETYYDGRVQPSTPVDLIPGTTPSKPGATLASELGTGNAVTLWGPKGPPNSLSSDVVLGTGFFNQDPFTQGITLLHELLHSVLQRDDDAIVAKYQILGVIGDSSSSAFEAWLQNDCNNPKNH